MTLYVVRNAYKILYAGTDEAAMAQTLPRRQYPQLGPPYLLEYKTRGASVHCTLSSAFRDSQKRLWRANPHNVKLSGITTDHLAKLEQRIAQ